MRAHFASDANTEELDAIHEGKQNANVETVETLEARIDDFKSDIQNLTVLEEFVDDVLHKAETVVENQQQQKQTSDDQTADNKQVYVQNAKLFLIIVSLLLCIILFYLFHFFWLISVNKAV